MRGLNGDLIQLAARIRRAHPEITAKPVHGTPSVRCPGCGVVTREAGTTWREEPCAACREPDTAA